MTIGTVDNPQYEPTCDECGAVLDSGEYDMCSTPAIIDDIDSMYWWQPVETPAGVRHYCPKHWRTAGDRGRMGPATEGLA